MNTLYNILLSSTEAILPVSGFFNKKIKMFIRGRREVFSYLEEKIDPKDKYIWIHVASLGEYEQAVPVIEMLKQNFHSYKILVTFFSPSGYENKKNSTLADVITYLPLDTAKNARRFLDLVKPELAFFVKYDLWPNYLKELRIRKTRTFLVSGAFRKNQLYFKNYGSWFKRTLYTFEHFFVQNRESKELLESQGFNNVTISGDTRFDRVSRQIEYDNHIDFIEEFVGKQLCVVAGSTWPEDEELLLDYINNSPENIKFIIAPHEINQEKIAALRKNINKKSALYSERESVNLREQHIFIVDTIGFLSRIYSYADIAYVGGAAGKTGLHNILEPATFGTPIIIGKNFEKFPEAIKLQQLAGLFSATSKEDLKEILDKLVQNESFRKKTGMIAGHFINSNTGATTIIKKYLTEPK